MAGQNIPYEGPDKRWNPFGLTGVLTRWFNYDYEQEPVFWTHRKFRWVRWHRNDKDAKIWKIHRKWYREENGEDSWPEPKYMPKLGPPDPVGWITVSVKPSFYFAINLPWLEGKTLHIHYGGRFMIADHRKPKEHGTIVWSLTRKVVSESFVW